MATAWVPRLVCGSSEFIGSISQRPWVASRSAIGGSERAAGGLRAAYNVRTDYLLRLGIRCLESEWPSLLAVIEEAFVTPDALVYYPDWLDDPGTSFTTDLWSPAEGDDIEGARGDDASGLGGAVFEMPLVLRALDGAQWTLNFYDV
jgi:hypothetical protein